MGKFFLIGLIVCFSVKLEAGTYLRDIPDTIKDVARSATSYEFYTSSEKSVKIAFPSDGQQPDSFLFYLDYSKFDAISLKKFFKKLEVFEGDFPEEEFEKLVNAPPRKELLYRICIEHLRINGKGEPCFSDGTSRPIKRVIFHKIPGDLNSDFTLYTILYEHFLELCGFTKLKNVPPMAEALNGTLTLYKQTLFLNRTSPCTYAMSFPSDGQQPNSHRLSFLSSDWPSNEILAAWYENFLGKLGVLETSVLDEFQHLVKIPLAKKYLYRICIELLRVNNRGKSCYQNGTPRPKDWLKKINFEKSTALINGELSYTEFLLFKLHEYFHKLYPYQLNTKTQLKDFVGKQEFGSLSRYKLSMEDEGEALPKTNLNPPLFPSNGQQPSSEEVAEFSIPMQEHWSTYKRLAIWYKNFFKLLEVFEKDIPPDFEILAQNPIGRALLYRICVELLRVNEEGTPCLQDGTPRPINKIAYEKFWDENFSAMDRSEILFFELLKYFHTLQAQRTSEDFIAVLKTEPEGNITNLTPLQLLPLQGVHNQDYSVPYYPGDDLSLEAYRMYNRTPSFFLCTNAKPCEEKTKKQIENYWNDFWSLGYCHYLSSNNSIAYSGYCLHINLKKEADSLSVTLQGKNTFKCPTMLDVFNHIYDSINESLCKYFKTGTLSKTLSSKEQAYERWKGLAQKERIRPIPPLRTYFYYYMIHITVENKILQPQKFQLKISSDVTQKFSTSAEIFWEDFENLVEQLLE